MVKLCSLFLSILMFFFPFLNIPEIKPDSDNAKTSYTNIFVHGLSGWGSYDLADKAMPYWGMSGGNLMTYLNARGYDCRSASVTATASAWDRGYSMIMDAKGNVITSIGRISVDDDVTIRMRDGKAIASIKEVE